MQPESQSVLEMSGLTVDARLDPLPPGDESRTTATESGGHVQSRCQPTTGSEPAYPNNQVEDIARNYHE